MKYIFLLLLFIFPKFSYSQTNIEGIGIFKVGKTKINIIDSLSKNGYDLEKCSDYIFLCKSNNRLKKKIFEPTEKDKIFVPLINEKKTYFVTGYQVASIDTENIQLDFYNDVLFSIKIDDLNFKLSNALDTKYKGVLTKTEKEITCSSIYGNYSRMEESFVLTLRNDNIFSQKVLSTYYNSKCEKGTLHYFSIVDKTIEKEVRILETKQRELNKTDQSIKELESLKDL